jgi:hypothetical protein
MADVWLEAHALTSAANVLAQLVRVVPVLQREPGGGGVRRCRAGGLRARGAPGLLSLRPLSRTSLGLRGGGDCLPSKRKSPTRMAGGMPGRTM